MINKNQYEKSIIMLKNNIPVYVRNAYTVFVKTYNSVYEMLNKLEETSPFSANELRSHYLEGKFTFNKLLHILLKNNPDHLNMIYEEIFNATEINEQPTINSDEKFSIVNGSDVYAPIEHIKSVITPFSAVKDAGTHDRMVVMFGVDKGLSFVMENKDETPFRKDVPVIYPEDIEGFLGNKTILDNLTGICSIDISTVFEFMACSVAKDIDLYDPSKAKDSFEAILNNLGDSEWSDKLITKATEQLLSTTMATYFIFASKLIGDKEDIFKWVYSAFVKNSMSNFDKANYPVNAPVVQAGNCLSMYETQSLKDNASIISMANTDGNRNDDAYKRAIYRNIRAQYSSWAAVINAILAPTFRNYEMNRQGLIDEEFERDFGKGMGTAKKFNGNGSQYSAILDLASEVFTRYADAKYKTYNTSIQIYPNGNTVDSVKLIRYGQVPVVDETAKSYILSAVGKCKNLFVNYTEKVSGILTINNNVCKALSDTFLRAAYLLMLNYVHTTMGKVMSEQDPVTGKSNKELFEEIYHSVRDKICSTIDNFSNEYESMCSVKDKIDAAVSEYTPYALKKCFCCCGNKEEDNDDHKEIIKASISETVGMVESVLGPAKPNPFFNLNEHMFYIPLNTEFTKIKNRTGFCKSYSSNVTFDQSVNTNEDSVFPTNKLIFESIGKYENVKTRHYGFANMESANAYMNALENLAEDSIEGADAMGVNACYSALGSIGGGITELEIKNESDYVSTDKIFGNMQEDTNGYAIKDGTDDTKDLRSILETAKENASAMESDYQRKLGEKVVRKYNEIFNKVVLGL